MSPTPSVYRKASPLSLSLSLPPPSFVHCLSHSNASAIEMQQQQYQKLNESYWSTLSAGRAMLPTPPDEILTCNRLPRRSSFTSESYCPHDDDALLAPACAVALEQLPTVNPLEESFRLLSFSTSTSGGTFAHRIRELCLRKNPERPVYLNLTHAVPLPMLQNFMSVLSPAVSAYLSAGSSSSSSSASSASNFFSSASSVSSHTATASQGYFSSTLFESYVVARPGAVVPPSSIHYAFSISLLPTHRLPNFTSFTQSRLSELLPGGVLILAHPTSLSFYYDTVLSVLDPLLHTLLALNKLSTGICQRLSEPPPPVPDFVRQKLILEEAGGEVLFSEERLTSVGDWGARWLSEEKDWISETMGSEGSISLSGDVVASSGTARRGSDVIDGLYRKSEDVAGMSKVGIYVVRKR
ncbi:hypothetical protein V1525DRAFT_392662 [Lipomyces kononenkoae]|uniref:Uncharacterized protein n=1 Tax=Lipomyces kononenkoae TaxID=34357 RepID=A0ACC3TBI7_LIPKO